MMIQVRKATPQDANDIAPIMLLAMQDIIFHFIDRTDVEQATHFLAHFISQRENQYSYENIWVAVDDDHRIIGQICLYDGQLLERLRQPILDELRDKYHRIMDTAQETEAGEIYLDTLAVSEHAQGKGIGQNLLHHAIDTFVHRQQKKIGLLVDKKNPGAKSLYIRNGFQVVKEKFIFGKEMEHLQYLPHHD